MVANEGAAHAADNNIGTMQYIAQPRSAPALFDRQHSTFAAQRFSSSVSDLRRMAEDLCRPERRDASLRLHGTTEECIKCRDILSA